MRPPSSRIARVPALLSALCIGLTNTSGCEQPTPPTSDDDLVPFEGAEVVKPGESAPNIPTGQFIVEQLNRYASQVPETLGVGSPQILWLEGQAPRRQGVVVVLLVRADIYRRTRDYRLEGPTDKLLIELMGSVEGKVVNLHRIPTGSTARVNLAAASFAQVVYAILGSAGLSGRLLNANRWVIGSFQESDSPVDAFRPLFDRFWEDCDSLRASQPVLSIGEQVLSEDDLRLKRLYQKAGKQVAWPSYAGSAPDPGLQFCPVTTLPAP